MLRRARPLLPPWLSAPLTLAGTLAALVLIALLLGVEVNRTLVATRGIEEGLAVPPPRLSVPRWGATVNLERYRDVAALNQALDVAQSAGLGTLRQRFSWAELEPQRGQFRGEEWDRILPLVRARGLRLIAVLDTTPAWARAVGEEDNPWSPPAQLEDYARFVRAFAQRYGEVVDAYQIWDQPNIAPHWGSGEIDPQGYVEMLRLSQAALRAADADGLLIAGGLAPNLESGGRNLSDVDYLREIMRRGAGAYFDVLGVYAYGFWSGPYERRVSPQVLNFSRVVLLREELVRRNEAHKPVWALEGGWCALPPEWAGRPSPQGNDTPFVQGERVEQAMRRIEQEWPWLGLACLAQLQPAAATDDPVWGYALLGPQGEAQPLLARLRARGAEERVLYPGLTEDVARSWSTTMADAATLRFWGTEASLIVNLGQGEGELWVSVDDGMPTRIALDPVSSRTETIRLAQRLPATTHALRVQGTPAARQALRGLWVGRRLERGPLGLVVAGSALLLLWYGWRAVRAARRIPWRAWWGQVRAAWQRLPPAARLGAVGVSWLLMAALPSAWLRLGALGLYGAVALLEPGAALGVALASLPLAPLLVRVGPGSFALSEISLLVAIAARLADELFVAHPRRRLRLSWLDGAVIALVGVAFLATWRAEYQKVAWRELRLALLEPALLYLLLRTTRSPREGGLAPVQWSGALWLAGVGGALYSLAVYPTSWGVIAAEGVRRARGFYGSPNNLALVLERLWPLGLAVALEPAAGRKVRWLAGLGSIPIALALVLTYSRGAWLLGLPALFWALAWLRGGRWRVSVVLLTLLGVLALLPLARTERFATLLDPTRGTTFLRVSLWQAAWDMARAHPLWGVGPDNFLYYYRDYLRPGAEVDRWLSHPHNLALDFWLRLGVGGLLVLLALLAGFWRCALARWRAWPPGLARALLLGLMAGMAAALAHGLIDSFYFVPELALWFMVALAWVQSATTEGKRPL
jgi:O-antigen ligase